MKMLSEVHFTSEYLAGLIEPSLDTAMISIADPDHIPPDVTPTGWGCFYQAFFIDGDYDAETIKTFGPQFRSTFSGYLMEEQAVEIRSFIHSAVEDSHIDKMIVHCTAGKSRSAAVAKYAAELSGGVLTGEHGLDHINTMVYQLLQKPSLYKSHLDEQRDDMQRVRAEGSMSALDQILGTVRRMWSTSA